MDFKANRDNGDLGTQIAVGAGISHELEPHVSILVNGLEHIASCEEAIEFATSVIEVAAKIKSDTAMVQTMSDLGYGKDEIGQFMQEIAKRHPDISDSGYSLGDDE